MGHRSSCSMAMWGRPDDLAAADRRALRRVHGRSLGRTRSRSIIRSAGIVRHGWLYRLPGRIRQRTRPRKAARGRVVVRWRACPRTLPPTPGIPMTLILASAYAGWAGSLPAEVAEKRLRDALALADLSREEFVRERRQLAHGVETTPRPASTASTTWPSSSRSVGCSRTMLCRRTR